MTTVRHQVTDLLKAFRTNNDPNSLTQASNLLESMEASTASNGADFKTIRAEKLTLLLDILNQIDGKRIVNFDFEDLPTMSVSPPPETGLPSGVDPAEIKDPAAKAKYERAVTENQQKAARYALQKKLAKLDLRVTGQAEGLISDAYTGSAADLAELNDLISNHVAGGRRKASLRHFIQTIHKR